MTTFIMVLVAFFLGMLVSDTLWLRKFGWLAVWKSKFKLWKLNRTK